MGTISFEQVAPVLKRAAREQGITYGDLARSLSLSTSAIKKILNAPDCSLGRLSGICEVLGLRVEDVIRTGARPPLDVVELSVAQQRFLLDSPPAMSVYWKLVAEQKSNARIAKEMGLTRPELHRILFRLDEHELVRFDGRQTKAPHFDHVVWGNDGPLIDVVRSQWSLNIVRRAHESLHRRGHRLSLRYYRLTRQAQEEADLAIAELLTELELRSATQRRFGTSGRRSYSLLIATAAASPLD